MRLINVDILADAMTKIRCVFCGMYLALFESEHRHGGTQPLHQVSLLPTTFAEFPSSKPMIPDVDLEM